MATKTEIANMAAARIGITQQMTDVETDAGPVAETLNLFFDDEVEVVLRDVPWRWATKYAALAGEAAAPNADWAFSYTYPADCVKIRRITTTSGRLETDPPRFAVADGLVFTTLTGASCEYTELVTDETKFDAAFNSMLAWRLAYQLSLALARTQELADWLLGRYREERAEAIRINASESNLELPSGDTSTRAREIFNLAMVRIGVTKSAIGLDSELSLEAMWPRVKFADERDYVLRDFNWPWARKYSEQPLIAGTQADPLDPDWYYAYHFPNDALYIRRVVTPQGRQSVYAPPFELGSNSGGTKRIMSNWYDTLETPDAWSSATAYVIGDLVSLSGTNYYCILGNTNQTPPNATYWLPLTSTQVLPIEYTRAVTDPDEFDVHFVSMLAWKIASTVAPSLKQAIVTDQQGRTQVRNGLDVAQWASANYQFERERAMVRALREGQHEKAPEAEWITDRDGVSGGRRDTWTAFPGGFTVS